MKLAVQYFRQMTETGKQTQWNIIIIQYALCNICLFLSFYSLVWDYFSWTMPAPSQQMEVPLEPIRMKVCYGGLVCHFISNFSWKILIAIKLVRDLCLLVSSTALSYSMHLTLISKQRHVSCKILFNLQSMIF